MGGTRSCLWLRGGLKHASFNRVDKIAWANARDCNGCSNLKTCCEEWYNSASKWGVKAFQLATPLGSAIDRSSTCIHLLMRTPQRNIFCTSSGLFKSPRACFNLFKILWCNIFNSCSWMWATSSAAGPIVVIRMGWRCLILVVCYSFPVI